MPPDEKNNETKTSKEETSTSLGDFKTDSSKVLLSTVETEAVATVKPEDDIKSDDGTKSEGASEKKEGKLSEDDIQNLNVSFQKSPRFQELMDKINKAEAKAIKAEAKLEAQSEILDGALKNGDQEQELDFTDVTQLSNEQLVQGFNENPKAFMANFGRQVYHEIMTQVSSQNEQMRKEETKARTQAQIDEHYAKFEKQNPDFVSKWDSGDIESYMKENPGHTPISAFHEMTFEERVSAAVEKAAKDLEKGKTKTTASKEAARTLSGGPGNGASRTVKVAPDLADTKSYGGLTEVLVARSLARDAERNKGG